MGFTILHSLVCLAFFMGGTLPVLVRTLTPSTGAARPLGADAFMRQTRPVLSLDAMLAPFFLMYQLSVCGCLVSWQQTLNLSGGVDSLCSLLEMPGPE